MTLALNSQRVQHASAPSAMSDLNSPEKPRSERSIEGSQPQSWSDVTLIEDITQEPASRHRSAQSMGVYIPSSSESEAEQSSPTKPQQAVCVVKRFRARSQTRGPALPIAPASDSTQSGTAPDTSEQPRLLPLHPVPRPRPGLPAPSQETDTSVVGELHQEAQNALGPAAGVPASQSGKLQTQNASAAEQRRFAAKLLRAATEVVSAPTRSRSP